MNNIYYVYSYKDPRTNNIFYIGKGKDYRWKRHLGKKMLERDNPKNRIIKEILSIGLFPIIEKLEENLTEEESFVKEQEWIKLIGKENLTNRTSGGQGVSGLIGPWTGKHHSDETKQLLRELRLGENNPNYGKKRSPEAIEKFKANHSGNKHWNYGKSRPIETREKIRNKLKGIQLTEDQKLQRKESMKKVWELRRQGNMSMPNHYH
jgi:hypothetical protein